jgi:glutathione S-transferase
MFKLFYSPGSAALAPHCALEEAGAAFELVLVDTKAGAHKRPEYLKLNPNGRVPTLAHGDFVMFESAAIMMHVADCHPASGLAPMPGTPERGHYYQWIAYLTNTVQEAYMQFFHAEYHCSTETAQADLKATAEKRLQPMFGILNEALAKGPYLLGPRFSAADLFLMMMARWSRNMSNPAINFPNIRRCIELVLARPAVERTMKAEGLS